MARMMKREGIGRGKMSEKRMMKPGGGVLILFSLFIPSLCSLILEA